MQIFVDSWFAFSAERGWARDGGIAVRFVIIPQRQLMTHADLGRRVLAALDVSFWTDPRAWLSRQRPKWTLEIRTDAEEIARRLEASATT